jgi:hypothetical protein
MKRLAMAVDTVTRTAPIAAAFRSRPLQVLLLLACGVTAVHAAEPKVVLGLGGYTCEFYWSLYSRGDQPDADSVFSWVQGYFSARNMYGHGVRQATVGGSLSPPTLESMFKDECSDLIDATREDVPKPTLYAAADALYRKLEAKGL